MKSKKLTLKVNKIEPNGSVILVPLVERETIYRDEKGKKISEARLKGKDLSTLKVEHKLKSNTDFWKETPAARLQLVPDTKEGAAMFKEGDLFEVTLKKI